MQMQVLFNTNTTLNNLYVQRLAERGLVEGQTASDLKRPTVLAYDGFCDSVAVTLSALPTPALQLLFNEMNDIRRKYSLRVPTPLDKDYTSVAPIPAEVHNGKHRTPLPRVFVTLDGELIELVFAVDFDVTYRNNVNVGTAHLYIHGKGKYTGTFVTTFQIVVSD
jgi:hypothetical protein